MQRLGVKRGRGLRVALWAALALLLVLVGSQLLLPTIAERVLRDRAGRYGKVLSAHLHALPAIELLWGHAQSATLAATSLTFLAPKQAVDLLWSGRGVTNLDLTATSLRVGPLRLRHVSLHKRAGLLYEQGLLTEGDLRAALPSGMELRSVAYRGGRVELGLSGGLFGVSIPVRALLGPSAGKLVVEPQGLVGLGGALTLFSDPRLRIEQVGLGAPLGRPVSWRLSLRARLSGS